MNPVRLPKPQDMVPGSEFEDAGCRIVLRSGKHGPHDRRVEVYCNGPISFQALALLLQALYVAEERYLAEGRGIGGEYLVNNLTAWIYWIRSHLGKAAPPGSTPEGPFGALFEGA